MQVAPDLNVTVTTVAYQQQVLNMLNIAQQSSQPKWEAHKGIAKIV